MDLLDRALIRRVAVRALAVAALFCAGAGAALADPYKDEKLGFSIDPPARWRQMPLSTDESAIGVEWQSPRRFETGDKRAGGTPWHHPTLDVVVIPLRPAKQAAGAKDDGVAVTSRRREATDLKTYLDQRMERARTGAYRFSREEEVAVGDARATLYEITVEQVAEGSRDATRRVWAWGFRGDDAVYGVVGEGLASQADKIRPDIEAAVRSFRIVRRAAAAPPEGAASGPPSEKLRREKFDRALARLRETLPEGWRIVESPNFAAVTHCDDTETRGALDHAEAVRAWLDGELGFVAAQPAGRVILRLCADEQERAAVAMTTQVPLSDRIEILTCRDRAGASGERRAELATGVWRFWLRDRNPKLSANLPPWLDVGLAATMGRAESRERRLTGFRAAPLNSDEHQRQRRSGDLRTARALFTLGWDVVGGAPETARQSEVLVRCLLAGAARRDPATREVLANYLRALMLLLDDGAKRDAGGSLLDAVAAKTFAGWSEREWAHLEALYTAEWDE